jgi:hypothetical protein
MSDMEVPAADPLPPTGVEDGGGGGGGGGGAALCCDGGGEACGGGAACSGGCGAGIWTVGASLRLWPQLAQVVAPAASAAPQLGQFVGVTMKRPPL